MNINCCAECGVDHPVTVNLYRGSELMVVCVSCSVKMMPHQALALGNSLVHGQRTAHGIATKRGRDGVWGRPRVAVPGQKLLDTLRKTGSTRGTAR